MQLRNTFLLGFVSMFIACGDVADDFSSACTDSTNLSTEMCDCIALRAEDELSPAAVSWLTYAFAGDKKRADEQRKEMSIADTMAAGMLMATAPAACGIDLNELPDIE